MAVAGLLLRLAQRQIGKTDIAGLASVVRIKGSQLAAGLLCFDALVTQSRLRALA
ncbi:MAG: hypothetical protein ACRYGK_05815 [Janthinobacterium lividum]